MTFIIKFILNLFFLTYIISANAGTNAFDQALKLKGNPQKGKIIFQLCANCHLDNGWGKKNGSFPVIAGQHTSVIIKQLKDIQARNRINPTMYPFATPQSIGGAQAIADVAAWISQLPANPSPGKGSGDSKTLKQGKKLYHSLCAKCHGKQGEGNFKKHYPKLSGQHYHYLLRQLQWLKDGYRKNGNRKMIAYISNLSRSDLQAVADYISRLGQK